MPNFRSYHLHLPGFLLADSKQMNYLYGIRVLRDLVNKIALFFLPIFLYQMGSAQATFLNNAQGVVQLSTFQWGMVAVASYFLFFRFTVLCCVFPVAQLIKNKGLARVLMYSLLAYIVLFSLLMGSTLYFWLIIPAAIVDGIQTALFWTPYHVLLGRGITKKAMGHGLGLIQFFVQLAAAVAPAIAGASIFFFGYSFIYLLSAVLVMLTIILSFHLENTRVVEQVSWEKMKRWLQRPLFRKLVVSFVGKYVNDATIVVWPLYVFLLIGAVDKVGYIYSISLFVAMILTLFIGSYIDHHKEKKLFFASGGILSALWVVRTAATTIWSIVFIDTIERLSSNFHWLFYDAKLFSGGKGSQSLSYFSFRELILSVAAIIFWSSFLLIFIFFESWNILFILAAVGVMLSLLVTDSIGKQVQ
jgi:MFS family permease